MVKKFRAAHPHETPEQILRRLDRQYLRDVTAIGGVTGVSAFVSGIDTEYTVGDRNGIQFNGGKNRR